MSLDLKKNKFYVFISMYLMVIVFLLSQVNPDTTIFHAYIRYIWMLAPTVAFSYLLIGPDIHTYIKNKQIVYQKILKILILMMLNFAFLHLAMMYTIEKKYREAQVQKIMIEKIYVNKGCHFIDLIEPLEKRMHSVCLEDFGIKDFAVPKKIWVIFGYHAFGVKIIKIKE